MLVLAKFDVRLGNQIVWSSERLEPGSVPGLEFKMIPSGVHDTDEDTIYFLCGKWQGIAVYARRGSERATAQMYSLALLSNKVMWNQEMFLKHELSKFMDVRDPSVISLGALGAPDAKCHPVLATDNFVQRYGPLVFELWKAGLARARLLLPAVASLREMSQFAYLVSRLASIPADVIHLLPDHRQNAADYACWHTVSLVDMGRMESTGGFVATTTDTILTQPSRGRCDAWADTDSVHWVATGENLRPTWRDRHRFAKFMEAMGLKFPSRLIDRLVDSTSSGLIWWASAGESALIDSEDQPLLYKPDGVALIGAFQHYTRELIRVFAQIANEDSGVIQVGIEDMAAMGLDPLAPQDRRFLQRFSLEWWDRPVVIRGCCCS